jgi:hypothetical protein
VDNRGTVKAKKVSQHKRDGMFDARFFGKNGDNINNLRNLVKNFNNYVNKVRIKSLAVPKVKSFKQ